MIQVLIGIGAILLLQLAVMAVGLKCDIAHDKRTKVGTKEREMSRLWEGILTGTLVLFIFGLVLELIGFFIFVQYVSPSYDRDVKMRCETIDGEFSERLNACYKNGTKIVFSGGEQVYEAE